MLKVEFENKVRAHNPWWEWHREDHIVPPLDRNPWHKQLRSNLLSPTRPGSIRLIGSSTQKVLEALVTVFADLDDTDNMLKRLIYVPDSCIDDGFSGRIRKIIAKQIPKEPDRCFLIVEEPSTINKAAALFDAQSGLIASLPHSAVLEIVRNVGNTDNLALTSTLKEQVNTYRESVGLHRMVSDDQLDEMAFTQAALMAAKRKIGHRGKNGQYVAKRAREIHYTGWAVFECVLSGIATPQQVVAEWLLSERHRKILESRYTNDIGVAVVWADQIVNGKSVKVPYWALVVGGMKIEREPLTWMRGMFVYAKILLDERRRTKR